jgi:hypothetical protein
VREKEKGERKEGATVTGAPFLNRHVEVGDGLADGATR